MTIQTKDVKNVNMSASSILGNSTEAADSVAKLAIYNVVENLISALIYNANDMSKKKVEESINEDLEKFVYEYLSQKLDDFKFSVLGTLKDLNYVSSVSRIDYNENHIKDIHVNLNIQITK